MTRFRIKYLHAGRHIACNFYASPDDQDKFEQLGAFTCNPHEFEDLQRELGNTNIQFVDRAVVEVKE